jgi:hypothetical protein
MTWQDIIKNSQFNKLKACVESQINIVVIDYEVGNRHNKLIVKNPITGNRRFVFVSNTPKSKGKCNLVISDIKKAFRQLGEVIERRD